MEPEDVTFELLQEITDGFSEERELGHGSFGVVYKGLTKNGEYVAVKILPDRFIDSDHQKQFQTEFDTLRKLKHQNIVRIYGYCYQMEKIPMELTEGREVLVEETKIALCLEYMHNGSLQKHLSNESSGLDWHTRYKILKGICEGLKHMHVELDQPLYHLDLKPDNILLDENWVPKLADFGSSRIFGKELKQTTESRIGTIGYQPPEHIDRGEISEKFDIFSLGVVMIRIVSGPEGYSKYADMHSDGTDGFIDLVKTNWRNMLQVRWSGSSLEAYCHQVETCTEIALKCVDKDSHKRPDIVKIVDELNEINVDSGKDPQKGSQMRMEPNYTTPDEREFVDKRETPWDVGGEFIVGRTEEKFKIMASLLQCNMAITILPIYGIGGIGKTTFAKLIYNDTKFNDYSRVWVYVSQRFDLNKVGNSIISQLSQKVEDQINETQMIHRLMKLLSDKKILIVLDDLWEEEPFKLMSLRNMLNPGGSKNTIVLVTTRSEHIAKNISTNIKPYKVESLTNDLCWDIIKQRSGFEGRFDKEHKEHLADIGREIALKCGGVALAAQSLGFMLRSMEYDMWIQVKDSDIWDESISKDDTTLPNHVLASLKLSCTKMDPSLLPCFTYCAIFPKGHHVIKKDLINQWISLGFIKPTKFQSSMHLLCEKYIVQLQGLSFLQHPMLPTKSNAHKKSLKLFTMHDLVHDLARLLMVDKILDASITGGQNYGYALLTDCNKPLLESLTDVHGMLRALHILDCGDKGLHANAFLNVKLLQVLDLSGCKYKIGHLPDSIGELVELRYLNAPSITNEKLPDSFTKLSKLIYLNLRSSSISALPDSICETEGLMHLDISCCFKIEGRLPESIVNLKQLVHLNLSFCKLKIPIKAISGLTNIQYLKLSRDLRCEYFNPESLKEVISNLIELRYLGLRGCYSGISRKCLDGYDLVKMSSLVDCICTLPHLEHLDLSHTGLVNLPESIGRLTKLQTLDLSMCENLVTLPKSICHLRKLHRLDLSFCDSLETLPDCMLKMGNLKVVNVEYCHRLLHDSTLSRSKYFATFPDFMVHADESGSNIGVLQHVNPEHLHIDGLEKVMSAEEVHIMKLSEKEAVERLELEWTRDARRYVEDVEVLGQLVPPVTLKSFQLRGYHSLSFPTWVMGITPYLPRVSKIELWELRKCNSLPPLGQLPMLEDLVMGGMDSIMEIEEGFCGAGARAFRELMTFRLCQMENLEVWNTTYSYGQNCVQEFMFPNLKLLSICDCPKLRLKPCPPATLSWEIENSDNVLSSWGEVGEIGASYRAALLSSWEKFRQLRDPEIMKIRGARLRDDLPIWDELSSFYNGHKKNVPRTRSRRDYLKKRSSRRDDTGEMSLSYALNKCRKAGASFNADPLNLTVLSSKLPMDQWRLLHRLLPTYMLEIVCCAYLTSCSQKIIRDLSFIKSLRLQDNAQPELPRWLGELTSLQKLGITNCPGLEAPLESIRQLTCLQYLCLHNCGSMSTPPQWLGELISLRKLAISDCRNLTDLPESMSRLTSLQKLELHSCPRITALPEWLGDLASLNNLFINDCGDIESLPETIQKLTKLNVLTIYAPKLAQWCKLPENAKKVARISSKDIRPSWDGPGCFTGEYCYDNDETVFEDDLFFDDYATEYDEDEVISSDADFESDEQ